MSKKYVYTLTQTSNNADGTTTALFEATLADGQGRHFERITAASLPAIFEKLGIEPRPELQPEPVKESGRVAEFQDIASLAASAS